MKRPFNILFVASVTFLATTGALRPCSCVDQTLAGRLKRADAVFVGKVIHLEVVGQKPALDDPTVGVTVNVVEETVEVSQVAKGSPPEKVTFITTDGCCYCDFLFQIGKSYLIFATADEATGWQTYICSGTKPLAQASSTSIHAPACRNRTRGAQVFASAPRPGEGRRAAQAGVGCGIVRGKREISRWP